VRTPEAERVVFVFFRTFGSRFAGASSCRTLSFVSAESWRGKKKCFVGCVNIWSVGGGGGGGGNGGEGLFVNVDGFDGGVGWIFVVFVVVVVDIVFFFGIDEERVWV